MKRDHRKNISSVILALAAAASMPFASLATTYYVSTNGTFTLDSASTTNAAGNRLDVSGSATLKLTGTATNGAFPLRLGIRFTTAAANAVLTVDATEVADCTSIRMTGDTRDNSGSATIALPSDMSEFVIGDPKRGAHDAKNMASFDINVMFGGEGCVVFTNDVTVARLPTCSWRIAPGARVATFGRLLFGDGDFALTDYDIELGNPASFANGASLTVPVGRALYVRPCRFNNSYDGTWIGESSVGASSSVYMTNNVVLGGAGAQVSYENGNDIFGINGTISGEGTVYVRNTGNVYMRGAFDWTGSFTVASLDNRSQQMYVFYPTNNATITPAIVVNHPYGGDFRFYPTGSVTGATELRLTSFAGNGTSQFTLLRVSANQTMTVGEISGSVRVVRGGAGAKLVVESLAENAAVYLPPSLDFTVKAAGSGARIILESAGGESESWSVSGPDSGAAVSPAFTFPDNAAASSLSLGGGLAFANTEPLPFGEVTIREGADISANIADGTKIVNEGGTLTQLVTTWRDKVTLWTDASAGDTFTLARDDFPSKASTINSYVRVSEWRDCRADHQHDGALRFRQTVFDDGTSMTSTNAGGFPQTNTTDKLCAVYCPPTRGRFRVSTGKNRNTTITVKYALFVFNSKNKGGGNAFFCTSGAVLKRVATPTSSATDAQKPLIYADANNAFSFRTNGVDVVSPTETYTTGGWQMISFANENGVTISNIGHASEPSTGSANGGQIFAEILLFSEMPTEEEREAAETYLSKKWNLPLGHGDVVQRQNVNVELSGSGMVSLAGDAVVSNGMYSGSVNLNGHRLELSTNALPYTEATLPAENRVLWVDPSATGAIDYSTDDAKADEVAYLYSRDNLGVVNSGTGYYLTSPYVAGGVDRRVRCVVGRRANGPALPWLVFLQKYSGDSDGNHLMIRSLPASPMTSHADSAAEIDVKAGFFALDTTDGGGTVIATRVNGSGDFALRQDRATEVIFKSTCSEAVRAADAWLDETQINPSSATYTYKPEVFAFNMQKSASAAKAKVIGFYGQGNKEIIGEFVLYSTTQTPTVREGISAYLMKKWLGKLREGFSDFREMTVSGDGVIAAEGPEFLPELTAAFTGSLEFLRTEWSFTLTKDGGPAAVDVVDLSDQTVALPSAVTVNLDVTGSKSGTYLLMRVGSLSSETTFTLGNVAGQRGRRVTISESNGELYVNVVAPGAVILLY